MVCHTPGCVGGYDFDHIAMYARKKFVDGCNTITLLEQAKTTREKEEIALVAMLDIDDNEVKDIEICCDHKEKCKITTCRAIIKELIEAELSSFPEN